MKIQIDDIFAALILSLVMLRRLDVKTTLAEHNPAVSAADFQRWRSLALRAYDQIAVASGAKVALSLGWFALGMRLGVQQPWFQLVGFAIFLAWALTLVWAWKIATDARYFRVEKGIRLRRELNKPAPPGRSTPARAAAAPPPDAAQPGAAQPSPAQPGAAQPGASD